MTRTGDAGAPETSGRVPVVHPVLFAVLPILFLFQYNRHQPVPLGHAAGLMTASAAFALLVWGGAYAFLKHARRSGALASLVVLLVLSYGHVVLATNEWRRRAGAVALHADSLLIVLPWALVLVGGSVLVARTRRPLGDATRLLNFVSATLVLISLAGSVVFAGSVPEPATAPPWTSVGTTPEDPPDVYYIVPDMYASTRVLRDHYGFDNAPFEDALRERGFHVVTESRANYPRTFLSVASTLNMRYLDDVPDAVGADSQDERLPYRMIGDNDVTRFLKAHGYRYVHFNSGWVGTEWSPEADETVQCGTRSQFERMFHRTTLMTLLDPHLYTEQRARIACQFDALASLPERDADAPRFVFAHVVSPHTPFVFDADGAPVDEVRALARAENVTAARQSLYVDQLEYVNARLLDTVDAIIAADPDAVVIVQSDHGPDLLGDWEDPDQVFLEERLRSFTAVRAPGVDAADALGADATNVNTFRVLFDAYFGTDLGRLEDRVYYSAPSAPYRFVDVTTETAFP